MMYRIPNNINMQRRGRDGEKEVKQQKGEERNKYLPVAFGYPRISVCYSAP